MFKNASKINHNSMKRKNPNTSSFSLHETFQKLVLSVFSETVKTSDVFGSCDA